MNLSQMQTYLIPAVLIAFLLWRFFKYRSVRAALPTLLAEGAIVIDVRSREEFTSGASKGSVNIPLDELERKADAFERDKPLVLCCASGNRSAIGVTRLKRKGFRNVRNAGSWRNTDL